MRLKAVTIETESSGLEATTFGMETTDPAVIQIMLENIYPDPYVWPRELLANWSDAGGGGELILPDALDPNWVIEDHGEGMTDTFMMNGYTKIFSSTKRGDDTTLGGFGHGRLSPLAYTDSYSVRSRFMHEGEVWEGTYLIYKGEDKIPNIARTSLAVSEVQQTGVTVTIPIGAKDVALLTERTKFYAQYLTTPPKGFESINYAFKTTRGGIRSVGRERIAPGMRLILGGVPYSIPQAYTDHNVRNDSFNVDLFFDIGELSPTLARDTVNGDTDTIALIKDRLLEVMKEYTEALQKEIDAKPSLLERYVLAQEIRNDRIPYLMRNLVQLSDVNSQLTGELVFTAAKGDFNLHNIYSETDKWQWEEMDEATRTFKSLTGLQIKRLAGQGFMQRHGDTEHGRDAFVNLQEYLPRRYSGSSKSTPQIMLFAAQMPYVTGQIKLIKEAMAAKMTKARTDGLLGKRAVAFLIQYKNLDDAKAIAKLLSPSLELTVIDDSAKRVNAAQYITVYQATTMNWARTVAMRTSALTDKDLVIHIRKSDEKGPAVSAMLNEIRGLDAFKGKRVISLLPADEKFLPKKYMKLSTAVMNWIKKDFPYERDEAKISAKITMVQQANSPIDIGVLKHGLRNAAHRAAPGTTLWQKLSEDDRLKDNKEFQDLIASLKAHKTQDVNVLYNIRDNAAIVKLLIDRGIVTKTMVGDATEDLPLVSARETAPIEAFKTKYPLLDFINDDYNMRNYGVTAETVAAIADYLTLKN